MMIAQISDTHILARSSERAEGGWRADNLRRCVADINLQQPDAVIHTGDIMQHGWPEEYEHIRELLAPLQAPIYVVPGNRDDRDVLRATLDGLVHMPEEGDFFHYTVDCHPLRLVALDSTAPKERKGVYCEERQAWLHETLARAADKPTVLLIHHPPFDIDDHYIGGYRRQQDADGLAAVVKRHPQVERMFCGHVHCPTQRSWAGTTATTMASVAVDVRKGIDETQAKRRPIYLLHEVSDKAGIVSGARLLVD
jgi:3',5'-cyclic AMP phosphodiesterase CpdA